MKWFSFQYLNSDERKELEKLRNEKVERENQKVVEGSIETSPQQKPYRNLYYSPSNQVITVVFNDGTVLTKIGDNSLFENVRNSTSEREIIELMKDVILLPKIEGDKEERELIKNNWGVLKDHEDFIIKGDEVYLKGVSLPLPAIVIASFIEVSEKLNLLQYGEAEKPDLEEQYSALKMFWYWTAINPIESSRNDLLNFVKNNDIKITSNGLLEMYRRVVSVGEQNKELTNFISSQYFKIKKWKKAPKNFFVVEEIEITEERVQEEGYYQENPNYEFDDDNDDFDESDSEEWVEGQTVIRKVEKKILKLRESVLNNDQVQGNVLGNLEELYLNLPELQENTYTDNHTKTKKIVIGSVYKEDEAKIDLNNQKTCSAGLHVGSSSFMFSGFGDTGVMALVNPMKVRSVPFNEANKMRVSEMFIVGVVDLEEYKEHVLTEEISDYSNEYFSQSVEELEELLRNKDFGQLECQGNFPDVKISDMNSIKDILKQRITTI